MAGDFFKKETCDVFIKKLYYIGDYFSPDRYNHNWSHLDEPPRNFHSFYYILEGEAILCPGNKRIHVHPNEVAYIPSGYKYSSYGIKAPFNWIMFSFQGDIAPGLFSDVTYDDNKYLKKIFEDINNSWMNKKPTYLLQVKSMIYNCLSELIIKGQQSNYSKLKKELIAKADEYIENNLMDNSFSIDKLINYCGTSDTYFREVFKEIHGTSPLKYINNLRIEKAKDYLKNTDISINKISELVGFLNIYYFSNTFKQFVGESPLQYRKRHNEIINI